MLRRRAVIPPHGEVMERDDWSNASDVQHAHGTSVFGRIFAGWETRSLGKLSINVRVWEIATGLLEKTYRGWLRVSSEVCWNQEGTKIAACFSNNTIAVLDF